jgi:hypothetical protein
VVRAARISVENSSNLEIGEEVVFVPSLYEEEATACSSWILFAKLKV